MVVHVRCGTEERDKILRCLEDVNYDGLCLNVFFSELNTFRDGVVKKKRTK